ncbi:hypothetical protein F4780DRAFT_736888 [Xylariomycetidae sp. FL0641]|nr:hypothetical protein F4780DRAFT_736888 [Xylariomycetidae sp. FL0641]
MFLRGGRTTRSISASTNPPACTRVFASTPPFLSYLTVIPTYLLAALIPSAATRSLVTSFPAAFLFFFFPSIDRRRVSPSSPETPPPAVECKHLTSHSSPPDFLSVRRNKNATMQENDVIAIIIIVLFIVLALIGFGIYRLVHMARHQGTLTSESSTGSSHSHRV